jgi:hypothetical protein
LLRGVGNFVNKNQDLVGNLVSGVGQGLLSGSEADADADLLRERYRLAGSNYADTDPGAGYRDIAPGTSRQTPTERFDPKTYGSFQYQYDPSVGRIVRVPV